MSFYLCNILVQWQCLLKHLWSEVEDNFTMRSAYLFLDKVYLLS